MPEGFIMNGAPGATRIPAATPGLGRRMQSKMQMVDMFVIAASTTRY
jgi:hypothetical protein